MADYIVHEEAEQLAETLIPAYHPHLTGIKIAHLLKLMPIPKQSKKPKKQPRQGRKITMAKTSKVSAKMQALAAQDFKFVIEYDSNIWEGLDADKKRALVDHELMHCGNDADGCYMRNHDVEEFRAIIDRHGFWKSDVQQFAAQTEQVYHRDQVAGAAE